MCNPLGPFLNNCTFKGHQFNYGMKRFIYLGIILQILTKTFSTDSENDVQESGNSLSLIEVYSWNSSEL